MSQEPAAPILRAAREPASIAGAGTDTPATARATAAPTPLSTCLAAGLPAAFGSFLHDACGLRIETLRAICGEDMPEPARQLLVHRRDMTSTLAQFHGGSLRVDVLQQRDIGGHYLREVFLRTCSADAVVEYGVIAIALAEFTAIQQAAIRAGRIPLGGLLHEFAVAFESSPIGFFSVHGDAFTNVHGAVLNGAMCYGRFNRLTRPTGEPLAWIMEILPPV